MTQDDVMAVKEVNLFVWIDSNGKHLKPEKFWRKGTKFERTYTLQDVKRALDTHRDVKIGCILISCGANDIEEKTGRDVARDIVDTVNRIKMEHPTTKIVVCEVTPFYARDHEVRACNEELHKQLTSDVYVVKLDNLRDESWSKFRDDGKHIKENCIALFAGNLIAALKRAHGIPPRNQRLQPGRRNEPSHSHNHNTTQPPPQQPPPPQQLMNNRIQYPAIDQRLQNIANGGDPKQNLISKLTDVIKCLQVW